MYHFDPCTICPPCEHSAHKRRRTKSPKTPETVASRIVHILDSFRANYGEDALKGALELIRSGLKSKPKKAA